MNILLIPPSISAYDVLTSFTRQLFESMRKSYENIFYYALNSAKTFKHDLMHIQDHHDITHVISFNAVAFKLFSDLQLKEINHIGWLVDYPTYNFPRLDIALSSASVITANWKHQKYIEEMTKSSFNSAMNIGISSNEIERPQLNLFSRDFDIAFVGGWMGEPVNFWQEINNLTLKKIAINSLEILLSDDLEDTYSIVIGQLLASEVDRSQNTDLINNLIMHLNDFQRKYSRLKMMNAVVQSGLKTLVVGNGWSDYFSGSHLFFHEAVPNELMGRIYENCKIAICLNSNNGACERALQAMASGCSVFSFGGIPIEKLAFKSAGVCVTKSSHTDYQISIELKKWHEKIMTNSSFHPNPIQFVQEHSWLNVSDRIYQSFQILNTTETG